MVTISGSYTATTTDSGWDGFTVPLPGVGVLAGTMITIKFTVTATSNTAYPYEFYPQLQQGPLASEVCFYKPLVSNTSLVGAVAQYGPLLEHTGDAWTGVASGCNTFDYWHTDLKIHGGNGVWVTFSFNYELTYTPGISSTVPCQYGVEKQQPGASIVQNSMPLLDALGLLSIGWWAVPLILAHYGAVVYLDTLCSDNPPVPQDIAAADWTTPREGQPYSVAVQKVIDNFNNTLWHKFCKCSPATGGGGAPVSPLTVNWNAPTYIVQTQNLTISNSTLANTLNQYFQYFFSIQTNNNSTLPLVQQAASCCGVTYVPGVNHGVVEGSGVFSIEPSVGLLIQIVERPESGRQLEGVPPYLWDMGWVSLSNGDGMLQEQRITRDAMVWLPAHAELGTDVGYYTHPGVQFTITELHRG